MLLGGVAHLGVHHPVGGQVLHALARHPGQVVRALHHRDGVVEGLQVALQRAAVGRLGEPAAERLGVLRGQVVTDLLGELEDGRGTQAAVEVVVQEDLGDGLDWSGVGAVGSAGPVAVVTGPSKHPTGAAPMRTFSTFEEIQSAVGEEIGTSEWVEVDQARVDQFADATGDHQWIHVDVERAKDGPFGGTIAHGYLTLSLIPWLGSKVFASTTPGQAQLRRQQGALPQPRARGVQDPGPGQRRRRRRHLGRQAADHEVRFVEIEGQDKPACVAETVVLLLG